MGFAGDRRNIEPNTLVYDGRSDHNLIVLSKRGQQTPLVLWTLRILVAIWPKIQGRVMLFQKTFLKPFPKKIVGR
jgi:hypothetical protein